MEIRQCMEVEIGGEILYHKWSSKHDELEIYKSYVSETYLIIHFTLLARNISGYIQNKVFIQTSKLQNGNKDSRRRDRNSLGDHLHQPYAKR